VSNSSDGTSQQEDIAAVYFDGASSRRRMVTLALGNQL